MSEQLLSNLVGAGIAIASVIVTLAGQYVLEQMKLRQQHVSDSRLPKTKACEELIEYLEETMSAIAEVRAAVATGTMTADHKSLRPLVEKRFRRKLWATIDSPECVTALNNYAEAMAPLLEQLVAGRLHEGTAGMLQEAHNSCGNALKTLVGFVGWIWSPDYKPKRWH